MLRDGSPLWDLRLVTLNGDTLVFRGNDSILRFPLMRVDELRLVRKATRAIPPGAGRSHGPRPGPGHAAARPPVFLLGESRPGPQQILRAPPPPERRRRVPGFSSPSPHRS